MLKKWLLILLGLPFVALDNLWKDQAGGEGGFSAIFGSQFVACNFYVRRDRLGYVILGNWPNDLPVAARSEDQRSFLDSRGIRLVRSSSGGLVPAVRDHTMLYFFQGDTLHSFRLALKPSELPYPHRFVGGSYEDVLAYFRTKALA